MTLTDVTQVEQQAAAPALEADFFGFQSRLTPEEQDAAVRIREFFRREVRPIADAFWARAEFPYEIIRPLAAQGVMGAFVPEVRAFENSAVYRGWVAMEMARVDASIATFVGVQNGLAMGSIGVGGDEAQRAEWLPRMATGEVIGAFGLTEPLSGSVRPNAPITSPLAIRGSHSARCAASPPTPIDPMASPFCTPTKVATLASMRASSRATQPRKTAEFSNGRVSAHGIPNSLRSASGRMICRGNSAFSQCSFTIGRTSASR